MRSGHETGWFKMRERTLFVFGLGYATGHFLTHYHSFFSHIIASYRGEISCRPGSAYVTQWLDLLADGAEGELQQALANADLLLVSAAPGPVGDPLLALLRDGPAHRLRLIIYLSTIGVYGHHDGAWVNETTAPRPALERSMQRLVAERQWQAYADKSGAGLAILRLSGIYGPARNPLVKLLEGKSRRIAKPGQYFNRIHVFDIAQTIFHLIMQRRVGIFNVTDCRPAPPDIVVEHAAALLKTAPPAREAFETADLTRMARSFYGENKRVANQKLRKLLPAGLFYPSYQAGLAAELARMDNEDSKFVEP